jgi:hypothetical protein
MTVSRTFAVTRNEAALETCFDLLGPAWIKLPQYLRGLKYQNPYEPKDPTLAMVHNSPGATPFEILFSSPHLKAFGLYIGTFTMRHKQWTDLYPVETQIVESFEGGEDSVMLVDVGGGLGHQAKLLKDTFPNIPGRLIVQDLHQMKGEVISEIEFQAHDFYQEQPVKGMYLHLS